MTDAESSAATLQALDQRQTDKLTAHLMKTEITDVDVARALKSLDDIESGAGNFPDDWRPYCQKCDEELEDSEMVGTAFGNFYHDRCVPSLDTGPMPLGQLLGGAENAI